jgi:hypothetical protein
MKVVDATIWGAYHTSLPPFAMAGAACDVVGCGFPPQTAFPVRARAKSEPDCFSFLIRISNSFQIQM